MALGPSVLTACCLVWKLRQSQLAQESAQRSLCWWAEEEIASSEMGAVVLAQLLQLMPGVLPASDHCCLSEKEEPANLLS